MKILKKLAVCLTLTSVLAVTASAGETDSPPCAPGETSTPPCALMMDAQNPTAPGDTQTPPTSESFDFFALAETAFALIF
jgi:hypothetical protein